MPRARTAPSPTAYTDHDQKLRTRFMDDFRFAAESLIAIKDRGNQSKRIPLKLNPKQERLHEMLERYRALNVFLALRARGPSAVEAAEKITKLGLVPKFMTHWKATLDELAAFGISKLLRLAEKEPELEGLHDGPVKVLIGKDRRGGISTYVEARFFHKTCFWPNLKVNVTAHTGDAAINVFGMSKDMYACWPNQYLRFRPDASSEGRARLRFDHGGSGASEFNVQTAGGKDQARSFGFDLIHLSEYAQYEDYAAVAATVSGSSALQHVWIIKESTARGAAGPFYEEWDHALDLDRVIEAYAHEDARQLAKWNGYVRFFLSWLEDPGYRIRCFDFEKKQIMSSLTGYEGALTARFPHVVPEQLKWRRAALKELESYTQDNLRGLTAEQYQQQEYPSDAAEMFQNSSLAIFNPERIAAMSLRASAVKPEIYARITQDGVVECSPGSANLIIYAEPRPGRQYVIGGDVGQGLKRGDWTTFHVIDQTDGTLAEEAALFRARMPAQEAGEVLTFLGEWYNEALVNPEVNGPGLTVNVRVQQNGYANIFHRQKPDLVKDTESSNAFYLGFYTSQQTKKLVVDTLAHAVNEGTILIRSLVILDEMRAFVNDDGKYTAPAGKNDDCVIGMAIAYWTHTRTLVDPQKLRDEIWKLKHAPNRTPAAEWYEQDVLARVKVRFAEARKRNQRELGADYEPPQDGWV